MNEFISGFLGLYATIQVSLVLCVLALWLMRGPVAAKQKLWSSRVLLASAVLVPVLFHPFFPNAQTQAPRSTGPSEVAPLLLKDLQTDVYNLVPETSVGDLVLEASSGRTAELSSALALSVLIGLAAYFFQRARLYLLLADSSSLRGFGRIKIRLATKHGSPIAFSVAGHRYIILDQRTNACPKLRKNAIAHELQHHRQQDPFFTHAVNILVAASWLNPFAWLIPGLCRDIDEYACDLAVTQRRNTSVHEYAECLLTIARNTRITHTPYHHKFICDMADSKRKSTLRKRVEVLLDDTSPAQGPWKYLVYSMTALAILSIACGSRTQGRPMSEASTPSKSASEQNSKRTTRIKGWFLAGDRPESYSIGFDSEVTHSGAQSGRLSSIHVDPPGFGTMMQSIGVGDYQGKRVQLKAFIKSQDVLRWAGMWMRVDGTARRSVAFDNMRNRPILGSTDWTEYAVVLDVPPEAKSIHFGVLINGPGTLWVDDMSMKVVPKSVPTTSIMNETDSRSQNLDFESNL